MVQTARLFLGVTDDGRNTDISLGCIPYEKRFMERAVKVDFNVAEPLVCCSAEDLVILKTVADRHIDRSDIRRIIQVSGRQMDWDLVFTELKMQLEMAEKPEAAKQLRGLLEREK